jgi:hypothetical protein
VFGAKLEKRAIVRCNSHQLIIAVRRYVYFTACSTAVEELSAQETQWYIILIHFPPMIFDFLYG